MSTNDDSASLSVAEKRFADRVCERYLLTLKSGGVVALLDLVTQLGHSDEMYAFYSVDSTEADPDGLLWFPRRDAHKLCVAVLNEVVRLARFPVNGGEYYIALEELKHSGEDPVVLDTPEGEKSLTDFRPEGEYITRVI